MTVVPSINTQDPSVARQIRQKEKLRNKLASFSSGSHSPSANGNGIPKGNYRVKQWVLLDLGLQPPSSFIENEWKLEIVCGSDSCTLSKGELAHLPFHEFCSNWHCVTAWPATDLKFEGVLVEDLLSYPPIKELISANIPNWKWVYCESADGYTVPIFREDFVAEKGEMDNNNNSLLILSCNGRPLSEGHGGPCRLLLPTLFGWKSAKWVVRWTFLNEYKPGFWERLGCHPRGRHVHNGRFDTKAEGIWTWLIAAPFAYRRMFGDRVWIIVMQFGGSLLGMIVRYFLSFLHEAPTTLNDKSNISIEKKEI